MSALCGVSEWFDEALRGADDRTPKAYANPVRVYEVDEGLVMFIGPDRSARMLEIGVVDGDLAPVIVHAMQARAKFLR